MSYASFSVDLTRKIAGILLTRICAYDDAIRTAIQAYNEYEYLRHQSDSNLCQWGLTRQTVSSEVFHKYYADKFRSGTRVNDWEFYLRHLPILHSPPHEALST